MIQVSANLSGIGSYIGAVRGTLEALEDPRFEGTFLNALTGEIRQKFMQDAILVNSSGGSDISHMFEWNTDKEGRKMTGDQPLFKLIRTGSNNSKVLSYTYLPSTKPVPLPDPSKYGFSSERLQYLRRHVFREKALIMETRSQVKITPQYSPKKVLFIPDKSNEKGYYYTRNSMTINPGGPGAMGGFARFWNDWFDSEGQHVATTFSAKTEEIIGKTGRKAVRHAAGTVIGGKSVGGQFASAQTISVGYIDGQTANQKATVLSELKGYYERLSAWNND